LNAAHGLDIDLFDISTSARTSAAMVMELKTKAAIGIGVPLGVILIFLFAGLVYANIQKKKRARGDVTDLEAYKPDENAPAPKVIKWNPNTYNG
jgi:hypothetical protein